jgi:hypothetical protein
MDSRNCQTSTASPAEPGGLFCWTRTTMRFLLIFFFTFSGAIAQSANGWAVQSNTAGQSVCAPDGFQYSSCPPWNKSCTLPIVQNGVAQVNYAYHSLCGGLTADWGSGWVVTKHNWHCFWGGGHAGYAGNEIPCINYSVNPPTVFLFTYPSVISASTVSIDPLPSDGAPAPGHAYQGLVYDPVHDRGYMIAQGLESGVTTQHAWYVDFGCTPIQNGANCWHQVSNYLGSGITDGVRCVWNPAGENIICEMGDTLYLESYNPVTDTWATLIAGTFCSGIPICTESQAIDGVVDPVRKQLWWFGTSINNGSIGTLTVYMNDLSTGGTIATQNFSALVTGCSTANAPYVGLAYDPNRGVIAIYPNVGNTIVLFNPTTGQCTNQTFSNGPPPSSWTTNNGINNRFGYFPSLGKFSIIENMDVNAYLFTLDLNPSAGLGNSTLNCLDLDGDGYGVGPPQAGPFTDLAIDPTTNTIVSSASYTFKANLDLGRHIQITSGAGWTTGDYAITAISAGAVMLDRSPGATSATGGSWVSNGCLGPDADDMDASVHSASDVTTKWGSISGWLNHLGYNATRIWYMDNAGNDSTCAVNSVGSSCRTWSHINSLVQPGDAILFRDQWNGLATPPSASAGTAGVIGSPYFLMSYPGERAALYPPGFTSAKIQITDSPYIVIDGFGLIGGAMISGGTSDSNTSPTSAHTIIRHVLASQDGGLAPIAAFNGLIDWTIEWCLLHDQDSTGTPHGMYLGLRAASYINRGVAVRHNIVYNSSYNNLHFNGRFSNLVVEGNRLYNAGIANISTQQGIGNSYFLDNIASTGNTTVDIDDYPGTVGGPPNCGPARNQTCTCPGSASSPGAANEYSICAYNQTGNLWANNTFYESNMTPCGNRFCTFAISTATSPGVNWQNTSDTAVQLGSSTWQNNIIVSYGRNNVYTGLHFRDGQSGTACSGPSSTNTSCQGWAISTTLINNTVFQSDGHAGNAMVSLGANNYTCSSSTSVLAGNTNCGTSDPGFVSASPSYWSTPSLFNFQLASGSASVHTGNAASIPYMDESGASYLPYSPSLGALEFSSNIAPAITTATLPNGSTLAAYSAAITVTGTPTPTCSITGGSFPGVTLSSGCALSGTPTTPGINTFTVTATNSAGSAPQSYSVDVRDSLRGPIIHR